MAGDDAARSASVIANTIKWGDFPTERGVIGGPVYGLFRNTDWHVPPTDPKAKPVTDAQGGWNTRPSDQFLSQWHASARAVHLHVQLLAER